MLTALIVDDEPLAREELRLLLQASGCIEVLGECAHALEALPAIHQHDRHVDTSRWISAHFPGQYGDYVQALHHQNDAEHCFPGGDICVRHRHHHV